MNILTPQPVGADGVFTSSHSGGTRLFRLTGGEKWEAREAWATKYEGYMTSPVVVGGHAYWLGKDQRLVCAEVDTGKEAWRTEKRFGQYASLVANGDRILALDQRGLLVMFRANPAEFEPLGEFRVSDAECWAHLAVAGNELYVRDADRLARWDFAAAPAPPLRPAAPAAIPSP